MIKIIHSKDYLTQPGE